MSLLDFIFPKRCFGCGRGESYICASCLSKVKKTELVCPVCEYPSIDGMTHVMCKKPQSLDGLISVWNYEGIIRKTIIELKYRFVEDCAKELAQLASTRLKAENLKLKDYVLIPIPLHKSRERWRGFNQSESIGKHIAKSMSWDFIPDLLIRKEKRASQTELNKEERKENIRGVFTINPNCLVPNDYCLVLFDDVWTTGSTMKEACKVLKRNGAKIVWGLTIAS